MFSSGIIGALFGLAIRKSHPTTTKLPSTIAARASSIRIGFAFFQNNAFAKMVASQAPSSILLSASSAFSAPREVEGTIIAAVRQLEESRLAQATPSTVLSVAQQSAESTPVPGSPTTFDGIFAEMEEVEDLYSSVELSASSLDLVPRALELGERIFAWMGMKPQLHTLQFYTIAESPPSSCSYGFVSISTLEPNDSRSNGTPSEYIDFLIDAILEDLMGGDDVELEPSESMALEPSGISDIPLEIVPFCLGKPRGLFL